MNTHPMKQIEATKERPFFSVCYQYEHSPWTLWSHHHWKGPGKGTQQGTSRFETAKEQALKLVTQPGIVLAQVFKSEDCYNHEMVFEARKAL